MTRPRKLTREQVIELATHEPPLTYREMNERTGLTRERCRQLVKEVGIDKPIVRNSAFYKNAKRRRVCPDCGGHKSPEAQRCQGCYSKIPRQRGNGEVIDAQGYVRLLYWNRPNGEMFEHRSIMVEHLGRALAPHERVYHKNGDRQDNRMENLSVCGYKYGYAGIRPTPNGKRWVAYVTMYKHTKYIGTYSTKEEAVEARRRFLEEKESV